MGFEWMVASRFLREGRVQTLLILSGIGVGVGVIVFLSALITGLQMSLIEKTLGTQPHIILRPLEEVARPQIDRTENDVLDHIQKPAQRLRTIPGWQQVLDQVKAVPGITAASPTVAGSGFALRGSANRSIALRGVDDATYSSILDLRSRMVEGHFDVGGNNAVIGVELARELGLQLGDKLRIKTAEERSEVFNIVGLFDVGLKDLNLRWVFVSLRQAQTLLNLSGGISTIELKVDELFEAENMARRVASSTHLIADSWMALNAQLLTGLRSQSSSSIMIQFFVIVAVVLGIASVLVVSVVQKSRQIGILRAFGVSRNQIRNLFLIQGGLLGLAGSVVGIVVGTTLAIFFQSLASNPDGSPTFPVALNLSLFLRTTFLALATGLLGAWLPARRAAKLDPAVAIRYE